MAILILQKHGLIIIIAITIVINNTQPRLFAHASNAINTRIIRTTDNQEPAAFIILSSSVMETNGNNYTYLICGFSSSTHIRLTNRLINTPQHQQRRTKETTNGCLNGINFVDLSVIKFNGLRTGSLLFLISL